MLRRLFGVAAGVAALTAVPVSFHPPEAGGVPAPAVSDLACSETKDCCFEFGSVCMFDGEPMIDHREAKGGTCR